MDKPADFEFDIDEDDDHHYEDEEGASLVRATSEENLELKNIPFMIRQAHPR